MTKIQIAKKNKNLVVFLKQPSNPCKHLIILNRQGWNYVGQGRGAMARVGLGMVLCGVRVMACVECK